MSFKSVVNVEVVKNDRVFIFSMPIGTPFGEAYDAAFTVLNEIAESAKEAASRAALPQEVASDTSTESPAN